MVGEGVQHCLLPSAVRIGCQLEDDATATALVTTLIAARERRAVQISGRVEDQVSNRLRSVATVRAGAEATQNALPPASVRVWC